MKKTLVFLITTAITILSFGQDKYCDPAMKDDVNHFISPDRATWLKDFNVHQDKAVNGKIEDVKFSMVLTSKTVYRFVFKNSDHYKGKVRFLLKDASENIVFSTTTNDYKPNPFDIEIKVTCPYHLYLSYPDGEEGCTAFAIYFVKVLKSNTEDPPFKGEAPTFQGGGYYTFMDYVENHLNLPKDIQLVDKDILIFYVEFEINADGKILNAKATGNDVQKYMVFAKEAERAVMSAPNWELKKEVKTLNFKMMVPVVFRILHIRKLQIVK
jgi:hypothetical protein